MRKSKKMKPGKLKGPSHKNGGILLEAEGGEYIIKKSSVKKIGKDKLDKINKEGKLPMGKYKKGGLASEESGGPKHKKWSKKYDKKWKKARKIAAKDYKKEQKYVAKKTTQELKKHLKKTGHWSKKEGMKGPDVNKDRFIDAQEFDATTKGLDILKRGKKKHGEAYKKTLGAKIRKHKERRLHKKMDKMKTKEPAYKSAKGGKVGDSIKTYSSGGYVEGK
tara:strand:+ start:7829 stop:8488 length:660 start_codon:yes stop_codon:yes gene_type:complete